MNTDSSSPNPHDLGTSSIMANTSLMARVRKLLVRVQKPACTPDKVPQNLPRTADELAHDRTDMASLRTMLAADRSLMAWVRTGLSMVSFGFTIYKILEGFQESGSISKAHSPQSVGLFLTGFGTIAILVGTIEYAYRIKQLRVYHYFRLCQPTFVMAMVMSITSLFLFVAIITKIL